MVHQQGPVLRLLFSGYLAKKLAKLPNNFLTEQPKNYGCLSHEILAIIWDINA